jgi:hypothetical protein
MANTLWQVIAAYIFAVAGGSISASLRLEHKPLCALISFAAGTLLGVTIFAILPESFGACPWWAVLLALITGYALFFFISKHVHHVCPACAASHFDADATRHFSEIATALIVALAIHRRLTVWFWESKAKRLRPVRQSGRCSLLCASTRFPKVSLSAAF